MQRSLIAALVVLGLTAGFQAWFLGLGSDAKNLSDLRLSNHYTEALAQGKSHLLVEPDPRVLQAADPFKSEYLLSDASLYHGRYYLYFGIVPFVTLLVPWFILTDTFLSAGGAIFCFNLLGYAACGAILLIVANRAKERPHWSWLAAAFLAAIFLGGTWPLMGRPAIYEIENSAAHTCLILSLLCLFLVEANHTRSPGLAMAAGFAALAIGCRPNCFPAVGLIGLWIVSRSFSFSPGPRGRAGLICLSLLPALLVGVALAWWNYHRFGHPLDFGLKYTVTQDPALVRPLISLDNLSSNLYRYTLGAAHLSPYFPFIDGSAEGPFRLGSTQEPSNQVYGLLWTSPLLVAALLLIPRRGERLQSVPRMFLALIGLLFLGNFAFYCLIPMSSYRYPADFIGPLALLASLGIMQVPAMLAGWKRWLGATAVLAGLICTVGVTVCVVFSIAQTHGLFDKRRPEDFALVARGFNQLAYARERLLNKPPHALKLSLGLPDNRTGQSEPLLVTGAPGAQDFLYIHYERPGVIWLGYESTGQGGARSAPLDIEANRPHEIEVRLGSMLPPDDHPLMRTIAPADIRLARQMLFVMLDGKVVLDCQIKSHPVRARIHVGESPDDPAFGPRFSGQIAATGAPIQPLVSPLRWSPEAYGPLTLSVELVPMPVGVSDPLLSLGQPGQGEQLLAEHLADGLVRLIWCGAQGGQLVSEPFQWAMRRPTEVVIRAGALLPPPTSSLWPKQMTLEERLRRKDMLSISIAGQPVLQGNWKALDVSPAMRVAGRDTLYLRAGVMPAILGNAHMLKEQPWP